MPGSIIVTQENAIATISLCNPGKLNAIDYTMWLELGTVMRRLSADTTLRCVIVRGQGGQTEQAFAAGGDLEEFAERRATLEQAMHYHGEIVAGALNAIDTCLHPTVASIQGPCIGGGLEIAAQCDLRICGQSASFGAPINRLGFSMYPGELASLLNLINPAVALEILLEGRIFKAQEAYEKGLVNRVVADAEVESETLKTAQRIAAGAPLAARAHKKLIRRLSHNLQALSAEEIIESFAFLKSTDYRIGMEAFFAKTKPEFTGS